MKTQLSILATLLLSTPAFAKTDVKGALAQLKANEENAKANQKQFDDNADVASKNIVEATTAVKLLRDQRAQLTGGVNNLEKNRAILGKVKERLQSFRHDEDAQIKREQAQVATLKEQIAKLEANQAKRQANIAAYDLKIAEVDQERAGWDGQRQNAGEIQKQIDAKEQKALAQREEWIEKRKGFRAEATKWSAESQNAEQTRIKFDRLAD